MKKVVEINFLWEVWPQKKILKIHHHNTDIIRCTIKLLKKFKNLPKKKNINISNKVVFKNIIILLYGHQKVLRIVLSISIVYLQN